MAYIWLIFWYFHYPPRQAEGDTGELLAGGGKENLTVQGVVYVMDRQVWLLEGAES